MFDLVNNQEVQAALIGVIVAVVTVVSGLLAILAVWVKVQKDRLESNGKAAVSLIATNAQDLANQVAAQTIIRNDLEHARAESATLTEQYKLMQAEARTAREAQIADAAKIELLTGQMIDALRRDAEKSIQIAELQRQKDAQAALITQLQSKQSEMAEALGLKDEVIRQAEREKDALQQRITELERQQGIDREQIASMRIEIEEQKGEIDKLKAFNRSVSASGATQIIPAVQPIVDVK